MEKRGGGCVCVCVCVCGGGLCVSTWIGNSTFHVWLGLAPSAAKIRVYPGTVTNEEMLKREIFCHSAIANEHARVMVMSQLKWASVGD